MTGANSGTYAYAGTDQVELTRAGTTTLQYGYEDQHGMPWLQSWTAGGTTVYVERDGLGTPLGLRIGTTDTAFVLDGLGTPVAAVKANGTLAATYKYDPYGNATTTDEYNLGANNIVRYTGGIYDQSTGFTKLGQRWYNPQQGRFTQQDNLSFIGNPKGRLVTRCRRCPAPVQRSAGEDDVVEVRDAGSGGGQCVGGAAVVAQDLEALHPGQSVFDPRPNSAMLDVEGFLPGG